MKLTKVDQDGYWWTKTKTNWCAKDKKGHWWLFRNQTQPDTKLDNKKEIKQLSSKLTTEQYLVIVLASALGISFALNIFYFILLWAVSFQ